VLAPEAAVGEDSLPAAPVPGAAGREPLRADVFPEEQPCESRLELRQRTDAEAERDERRDAERGQREQPDREPAGEQQREAERAGDQRRGEVCE
jgi:hypothetical protein